MPARTIPQRTRFLLAVEGEGEQSFVKWLQELADFGGLRIHLDCKPLSGGGLESMLKRSIVYRKRGLTRPYQASYLIVDADRADRGDCSIDELRRQAHRSNIRVCVQEPNQEGLLLRMLPGNECLRPDKESAMRLLRAQWPDYEKPVDAYTLSQRFSIDDLRRVAVFDHDLQHLLTVIGLLE